MTIQPATLTRPNGKTYRARKVIAHAWSNLAIGTGDDEGVVILGTQDIEACREFATQMVRYWGMGRYVAGAVPGWYRDSYYGSNGERRWVDDPERGAAGVIWTAVDEEPT